MKECNQCGKCCVKYGNGRLSVTADEVDMWVLFSPDIADYVAKGKIWASPDTGKLLDYCPWLRKNPISGLHTCDIYYDRPSDCRYYPVTVQQMIQDECEMLEKNDLINPVKTQAALDKLMEDSRPSFD
ncbi:YkgJ family cysteine cluster protein [Alteromonas sp. 5E99-2]|uniref:YkgJ family cysteine cluster protein n=1 Tax=Alteromonas sp. 5E99-2 TaxID=2817683 RepID=UPI001A98AA13|nr:YkgJ family cysteine cluster protein [Alteromonas sp. 5E99-2]